MRSEKLTEEMVQQAGPIEGTTLYRLPDGDTDKNGNGLFLFRWWTGEKTWKILYENGWLKLMPLHTSSPSAWSGCRKLLILGCLPLADILGSPSHRLCKSLIILSRQTCV